MFDVGHLLLEDLRLGDVFLFWLYDNFRSSTTQPIDVANSRCAIRDPVRLGLTSKTPVWNRIKKLKAGGVIDRQVAIVNPDAIGLGMCFYVLVRTAEHEAGWIEQFLTALKKRPEIMEAHRLAGDVDYILKVRVADAAAYDAFYRGLTADISIFNVTSLLSMEELISTTKLPIADITSD